MCGRFVSSSPPDEIGKYFDVAEVAEQALGPNYNVAPTSDVYAVVERPVQQDDGQDEAEDASEPETVRRLDTFHWGLVPFWAKDPSVGNRMINARAETISEKNSFKRPLSRTRCIIPADGFYEWKKITGAKKKQPMFIHHVDGDPLAFAGLFERWKIKDASGEPTGELLESCTIITTGANDTMAPVHDRMPVILPPLAWAEWLDPTNKDVESLTGLLVPAPNQVLTMHPVSTDVGNVRNRGEYLIEPISEEDTLFS